MNSLVVDVAKIRAYLKKVRHITGAKVCAVAKANCYGVGIQLCPHISDLVDYFAVATMQEAIELRRLVANKILVLSPPVISDIGLLTPENMAGIEFAVDSLATLKKLAKTGKNYNLHLVANTGMNRYGATRQEFESMVHYAKRHSNLYVAGAFSHFLKGDARTKMRQYAAFTPCVKLVKQNFPDAICHISNSNGTDYPLDMVRIGIGLYDPAGAGVTTLASSVVKINSVPAGQSVGYGSRFKPKNAAKIAVVPMGYADGIMRKFSGANVMVEGTLCPIVGSVCMDCFFVDVTNCPRAKVGSKVIIWGQAGKQHLDICNLAKKCGTINYELLTHIGSRVNRKYKL